MPQLTVKNRISELTQINDWLASLDGFDRLGEQLAHHLLFVVEESFVNIVKYAFDDENEHLITLTYLSDNSRIQVAISDNGIPFNPTAHVAPDHEKRLEQRAAGGEGIYISRKLIPNLTYVREGDQNRMTVCVPLTS